MKAPRLGSGDHIRIVSPSWGGPAHYPHRVERGVEHLRSLGYEVRLASHAQNSMGEVSDTPENRADDINGAFADPEVKAIVAAIGGDHSCHLLPLLDWDLIRKNPKIFMGYSDVTVLNVAIWKQTGLVTFNGPALMVEIAEFPRMHRYTEQHMIKAVGEARPVGPVQQSTWWTEELLDWDEKEDLTRPRKVETSQGWSWLRDGHGEGILLGGCLESMQHLRGTPYWPDPEQWEGAVLFLEPSEEAPSPATVDGILMDYENMGVLERIGGLLFGRPMGYTEEQREQLREVLLERTESFGFPVVADMDFGHTSPVITLPLGCRAVVDAPTKRFEISEPAVV